MTKLCNLDRNDLQPLNWLTSLDLPCLQQEHQGQAEFSMSAQNELHAEAQLRNMSVAGAGTLMVHVENNMQHSPLGINSHIHTPHSQKTEPKTFPKPIYPYRCLIAMALMNSKTGSLPVSKIYSFMKKHFPYFKTAPDNWRNSVRHNLSLSKCFKKVENELHGSLRKGCLWALNPAKIDKMKEEMQKWKCKELPAIECSTANPDEIDSLITDRPECCRNTLDPQLPPPQPVLHPHCSNVHHQLQLQLHTQPNITPMCQTQTPPQTPPPPPSASQPKPSEIFSDQSNVLSEGDVLDPSILNFYLQENLWDEMKVVSFNLEDLGFSNPPFHFSEGDLDCVNEMPVSSADEFTFSSAFMNCVF